MANSNILRKIQYILICLRLLVRRPEKAQFKKDIAVLRNGAHKERNYSSVCLVNSVLNFRVPWNAGKLSSGLTFSGFSSNAQLHIVSYQLRVLLIVPLTNSCIPLPTAVHSMYQSVVDFVSRCSATILDNKHVTASMLMSFRLVAFSFCSPCSLHTDNRENTVSNTSFIE
jgi:hypothetical protein